MWARKRCSIAGSRKLQVDGVESARQSGSCVGLVGSRDLRGRARFSWPG